MHKTPEDIQMKWENKIKDLLIGRKIVAVQYMSEKQVEETGWYKRPIIIVFDDDSYIIPMMDDEGNDGGALATSSEELPTIPVL